MEVQAFLTTRTTNHLKIENKLQIKSIYDSLNNEIEIITRLNLSGGS